MGSCVSNDHEISLDMLLLKYHWIFCPCYLENRPKPPTGNDINDHLPSILFFRKGDQAWKVTWMMSRDKGHVNNR